MHPALLIRAAYAADQDAIWAILEPIIRAGKTFALPRDMGEADGRVVGAYFLRSIRWRRRGHAASWPCNSTSS